MACHQDGGCGGVGVGPGGHRELWTLLHVWAHQSLAEAQEASAGGPSRMLQSGPGQPGCRTQGVAMATQVLSAPQHLVVPKNSGAGTLTAQP